MTQQVIRLGRSHTDLRHAAHDLAHAGPLAGITAAVAGWFRRQRQLSAMRATQRELQGLDDATLRDIGVGRASASAWAAEVHGVAPTSLARLERLERRERRERLERLERQRHAERQRAMKGRW